GQYLMEDFYYAGGLRALLAQLGDLLHLDRPTVTGQTLRQAIEGAQTFHDDVIRPRDKPVAAEGGLAVLRGNLAPRGAVIKPLAADPKLLKHSGPAVVFDGYPDLLARIDDPALDVDGDVISLDVGERRLEVLVPPAELARRRAAWSPPPQRYPRGYGALHAAHITQADEGCDFDFLAAPGQTPEPDAR